MDMPDFADETSRAPFAGDHWSPWPEHAGLGHAGLGHAGPGQPPSSILGELEPTAQARERARKIWDDMGYEGDDR